MANGIPVIKRCTVSQCAYNLDNHCHTPAITVGEGSEPVCDTFLCDICVKTVDKGGTRQANALVGACKIEDCAHNHSLECAAQAIVVDVREDRPECETFAPAKEEK